MGQNSSVHLPPQIVALGSKLSCYYWHHRKKQCACAGKTFEPKCSGYQPTVRPIVKKILVVWFSHSLLAAVLVVATPCAPLQGVPTTKTAARRLVFTKTKTKLKLTKKIRDWNSMFVLRLVFCNKLFLAPNVKFVNKIHVSPFCCWHHFARCRGNYLSASSSKPAHAETF